MSACGSSNSYYDYWIAITDKLFSVEQIKLSPYPT